MSGAVIPASEPGSFPNLDSCPMLNSKKIIASI